MVLIMAVVLEGSIFYESGQAVDGSDSHWIWKGSWRFQGRNAKSHFQYKHLRPDEVEKENKSKTSEVQSGPDDLVIKEVLDSLIKKLEQKGEPRSGTLDDQKDKPQVAEEKDKDDKGLEKETKDASQNDAMKPPPLKIPDTPVALDSTSKPSTPGASTPTPPSAQPKSKPPFLHLMGGLKRSAPPDLDEMAGTWQGHFNLTDQKTGVSNDISETFELEFVPMPAQELDAYGHKRRGARKKSERGDVRVTGSGGNQFGVFTLKGSYDGNTRFLALERLYQTTPGPKQEKKRTKKKSAPHSSPLGSPLGQASSTADNSLGFGVEVDEELGLVRKSKRQRSSTASAFLYDFISDSVHFRPDIGDKASKKKERTDRREEKMDEDTPKTTKRDRKKSSADQDGSSKGNVQLGVAQHFIPAVPTVKKVGRPKGGSKAAKEKLNTIGWAAFSKKKRHGNEHPNWRSAYLVSEESGEIYEGGWLHGKRHYIGVCVYSNGNMYEGEWRHGLEHGKGKLMTPERGIIFEGCFKEGKIEGKGLYYFPKGDRYDGDWKENTRHGKGTYLTSGGARYDGNWHDGMRNGPGVFTWPDGSTYDGNWNNDMRHGKGTLKLANGFYYEGQWCEDMMEGKGVCKYVDGSRYEGTFHEGKKEGRGTLHFKNGAKYEGKFQDDKIMGKGTLEFDLPVEDVKEGDYMIPIELNNMEQMHIKAGFDKEGQ